MNTALRLALAAATTACLATSAFAQNITLRSSDTHPEGYPTVEAVKHMGELLAERSGGRIGVTVYHSSQLGEESDAIEQTRFGVIDMIRSAFGPFANTIPQATVVSLPYVFRSVDHMRKVVDGPIGDELLAAFEPYGLVGLAFYDAGARSFYNRKQEVTDLAGLGGLKFRTQQSDVVVAMVAALKADAVPMPYGEVYSAIQTGVLDGAENNLPSYVSSGHFEVAKFLTLDEHLIMPELIAISSITWAKLSPEDQALVRQAARDSVVHQRQLWDTAEAEAVAAITAAGGTMTEVDKQPFIDAMAPVYDRFLTTPELRDLLARIQAVE